MSIEADQPQPVKPAERATRISDIDFKTLFRRSFGPSFWGFAAVAVLTGALCYAIMGPGAFSAGANKDIALILATLPRVVAALGIAGMLWVLLPREKLALLIGEDSGFKGLLIAAFGGMITPGGPSSAFALLAVLAAAGANRGPLIAYITAWSMLGLQRILMWDVPLMGADFSITRFCLSLVLPVIAGWLAARLPLKLHLREEAGLR